MPCKLYPACDKCGEREDCPKIFCEKAEEEFITNQERKRAKWIKKKNILREMQDEGS